MHEFTIGGVVRLTARLLRRHAGALLVLVVLLRVLPWAAYAAAITHSMGAGLTGWVILPATLEILSRILLQIAVIATVVGVGDDRTPTIGGSLGLAGTLFLPTLAIDLLSAVPILPARVLLVFPALMLACRWYVAVPVAIVERPGIVEAFRRSATLTEGLRWYILGCSWFLASLVYLPR